MKHFQPNYGKICTNILKRKYQKHVKELFGKKLIFIDPLIQEARDGNIEPLEDALFNSDYILYTELVDMHKQ